MLLPTPFQQFIATSRYSRWLETKKRRETWPETVSRYMQYMFHDLFEKNKFPPISEAEYNEIQASILNLKTMPSMRALMTSGPALARDATVGYNCSYLPLKDLRSFDELLYLLMGGVGVGFSVEKYYTDQLPPIPACLENKPEHIIIVADSRKGWCIAFKELLSCIYKGFIPIWDTSYVRKAGVPLKTMGGRASGPQSLIKLFEFTVEMAKQATGRKLTPYECHSLACMCGEIVVVGGVRRCLAADTPIWCTTKTAVAARTSVLIQDIKPGDEVRTMLGWRRVKRVFKQGKKPCYALHYRPFADQTCETLIATPDHPIAVIAENTVWWKPLISLKKGDVLYVPNLNDPAKDDFRNCKVDRIEEYMVKETYDLEIDLNSNDEEYLGRSFMAKSILVHNSALISLSDPNDTEMRKAKSGNWWETKGYLALANNSACYNEKPNMSLFFDEWHSLYESKSGERGIFSRSAAIKHIRSLGVRNADPYWFGCNPCCEIILLCYEFCNLSEIVARSNDPMEILKAKIRIATILGTIQSCLTHFKYIRKEWKQNALTERLLGVSLTGIYDCPLLYEREGLPERLKALKAVATQTNSEWADRLGIPRSAAITCVKPSGTVSCLTDASSGIHPRWSKYYIRTVRCDKKDPMYFFLKEQGIPVEDQLGKEESVAVFSFYFKAPETAVCRKDVSAIDHLELWKIYAEHWCDHKPSVTINVKEDEWLKVGAWVYDNIDIVSGISFLPYQDHIYKQAPYQEIDESTYLEGMKKMPDSISWDLLGKYELQDRAKFIQNFACTGDQCEYIDI